MKNQAMEQYLKKLKKALRCPQPDKAELLAQGKALLMNFSEESPEADYEAFVTAFGPPEVFAGEMLDTLDQETLKRAQIGRKWLLCSAAALAVILVMTATFWFAGQVTPEPDKDEQVPKISIISDDDPENPVVFSFGFSPDELQGSFYWNQHSNEP